MNPTLERQLILSMYSQHLKQQREWFRFYEIVVISGIRKSSLQRILPRLINRGWIERLQELSFSPNEPQAAIIHLLGSEDVQNYRLPLWQWPPSASDNNNNTTDNVQRPRQRKIRQLATPRPYFPKEVADQYVKKLPSLERKVITGMESGLENIYGKQNYKEAELERAKQSRGTNKLSSSKKAIRFRGQADLFDDIYQNTIPKEYEFYRVIVLPYLRFPALRPPSLQLKDIVWKNIPKDKKRFWENARQELIKQIRQSEKVIPLKRRQSGALCYACMSSKPVGYYYYL